MSAYNPKVKRHILLGFTFKEEGINYLSDAAFMGETVPGPGKYEYKDSYKHV